jgi:hypothetical protein
MVEELYLIVIIERYNLLTALYFMLYFLQESQHMKKILLLSMLFLFPGRLLAVTPSVGDTGHLDWTINKSWKIPVKPMDFSQSLDNKKVYILGEDSKVYIYSADGKQLGAIPVDKSTTAIDIAPEGDMLYLIGTNLTYTAIDISFVKNIDITGSPFLGPKNAVVTMVLFSDFQ